MTVDEFMKKFPIVTLVLLITNTIQSCEKTFIIRQATPGDIDRIMSINEEVSHRDFVRVFKEGYSDYEIGKNADAVITEMMQYDRANYPEILRHQTKRFIYLAEDKKTHEPLGFLDSEQIDETTIKLEMFCIKTKARGIGIGKALVEHLERSHPDIKILEVYPYKKANDDALAFYKKIGFSQVSIESFTDFHKWHRSSRVPSEELYIHMKKDINREK